MDKLGEYLIKLRKDKSKSIRKASEEIGISHTYLDSLEKGYDPRTKKGRTPTPDVLKKISNYYNVSFIELLKMSGQLNGMGNLNDGEFLQFIGNTVLTEASDEINLTKLITGVLNGKRLVLGIDSKLTQQESNIVVHILHAFSTKLIQRKEALSTDEVNKIMEKFDKILEMTE